MRDAEPTHDKAEPMVWRRGDELSPEELYGLLALRVDVFVVEQGCIYHETDGLDLAETTWHGYLGDAIRPLAYVRILGHEVPCRIGRVATRRTERGQGLARSLLTIAHRRCGEEGSQLAAQWHLREWYEEQGWVVSGTKFVEHGIEHVSMLRPSGPA